MCGSQCIYVWIPDTTCSITKTNSGVWNILFHSDVSHKFKVSIGVVNFQTRLSILKVPRVRDNISFE